MFTGALLGYMWGWIWGWSLFDPNSDIWALAAGLGAIAGLIFGSVSSSRQRDVCILSMTIGLYPSWLARTLLFGDIPGGWGVLLMAGGTVLSGAIGIHLNRQADSALLPGLAGALYIGFFGGFLINVIVLDKVLGWIQTNSILNQAPAVFICGAIGGFSVAQWVSRKKRHAT
jgi:hypothetical protein